MADRTAFMEAISTVFEFCDLTFWYSETYLRSVNGETGEGPYPRLDWEDFSIVNAFWSLFGLMLMYAEKEGFGSFGLDMLDDGEGILSFREPVVDSGFGRIVGTAWDNMCEKYGYFYPENLNFSPKGQDWVIEDTPAVTCFSELDRALQVSMTDLDYFYCCRSAGTAAEEYLDANYDDIETTASSSDFCIYCLVNRKFWELQDFMRDNDVMLTGELATRYGVLRTHIGSICGTGSGWGNGNTVTLSDGRTAEYETVDYLSDESGYDLITPPILSFANVIAMFNMEETDKELEALARDIKASVPPERRKK